MLKQVSEKIETGLFLGCIIYLFSPWVGINVSYLALEIKMCNIITVFVFVLLGISIWRHVRDGNFRVELSSLDIIVALYGCYLGVLCLLSWNTLDRGVLLLHVACALLYIYARNTGGRCMRCVLLAFPFLLLWQLWHGIAEQTQYFYPGMGITLVHGSFLNTSIWSCFVACVAVIMVGSIHLYSSLWVKSFYGMGILLSVVLLFIGNSRAAWLGFAVGCGYILYRTARKRCRIGNWGIVLMFVGLLVTTGVYTSHKVDSALGRLLVWKVSGRMCMEHPWGTGMNGFQRNYMSYQEQYFMDGETDKEKMLADETIFAFNDLLQVVVEQGIVGLLLFAFLLYNMLNTRDLRKERLQETRVIRGVLFVWLVFSLFSYPSSQLQTKAIFVVFVAMLSSKKTTVWSFDGKWLGGFGGLVGLLFCVLEVHPYRQAVDEWSVYMKRREIPGTGMDPVFCPLMNSAYFLSNYSMLLNLAGECERAVMLADRGVRLYHSYGCCLEKGKALKQLGEYQLAEICWVKAGNLIPNRFRPLYLRMEMWENVGNRDRAVGLADTLLHKKVKVRSPELSYFLERAEQIYNN